MHVEECLAAQSRGVQPASRVQDEETRAAAEEHVPQPQGCATGAPCPASSAGHVASLPREQVLGLEHGSENDVSGERPARGQEGSACRGGYGGSDAATAGMSSAPQPSVRDTWEEELIGSSRPGSGKSDKQPIAEEARKGPTLTPPKRNSSVMAAGSSRSGGGGGGGGVRYIRRRGAGGVINPADLPPAPLDLLRTESLAQGRISLPGGPVVRHVAPRAPTAAVLQPGMVLMKQWLQLSVQQRMVGAANEIAHRLHRPSTAGGRKYHIYSTCWGSMWDGTANRYVQDPQGMSLPPWLRQLAQGLAAEAQALTPVVAPGAAFEPDIALVNYYPERAEELGVIGLGGHQDLDDTCQMPVVSVSVGDAMTFFYRRLPPLSRRKSGVMVRVDSEAARGCEDGDAANNREHGVLLESGDVLVFGGESRLVFHGTRHLRPGTKPPGLKAAPGRLNFTFRQHDVPGGRPPPAAASGPPLL